MTFNLILPMLSLRQPSIFIGNIIINRQPYKRTRRMTNNQSILEKYVVLALAVMFEQYIVKKTMKKFAYFLVSKLKFAMRTLFDEYTLRLDFINTINAEECVAFHALMRICWDLVANYTLKAFGIYGYRLWKLSIKLKFGFRQLSQYFLMHFYISI